MAVECDNDREWESQSIRGLMEVICVDIMENWYSCPP